MTKGRFFTQKNASLMLFIFVAACFTFLFMTDPLSADDLSFIGEFRRHSGVDDNGCIADFRKALTRTILHRYQYDVARSGNFIAICSLCLPPWIASAFISICFSIMLWLMANLAGIRRRDFALFSLLVFLLVFGIIWWDGMYSIMYGFNYVCSSLLMLAAIKLFIGEKRINLFFAVMFGLLTGSWHESFSVTLIAGGIITLSINRKMIRADRIVLLVAIAIGSLFIFTAPSFMHRSRTFSETDIYQVRFLYAWPYFIMVFLSALCPFRKKWRRIPLNPIVIFALASGGLLLLVFVTSRLRAFFPTLLLSCVAIPFIASKMFPAFFDRRFYPMLISMPATACVAVHLCAVCPFALTYRHNMIETQRQLETDDRLEQSRTVFVPVTFHYQASPLALSRPNKRYDSTLYSLYAYYHCHLSIVPIELKDYNDNMGKPIPSNIDVKVYKSHLVTKRAIGTETVRMNIHYGKRAESTFAHVNSFIGKDGYIYFFLSPVRSAISNFSGEPTEVYL